MVRGSRPRIRIFVDIFVKLKKVSGADLKGNIVIVDGATLLYEELIYLLIVLGNVPSQYRRLKVAL